MSSSSPADKVRAIYSKSSKRQRWLNVEAALARAEANLGIIPDAAADAIIANASLHLLDEAELDRQESITGHVMVPIIRELSRISGAEAGSWVHWGATTQNIQQSGDTVGTVQALDVIEQQADRVIRVLAKLSVEHRDTLMAGRTHWQQAVPITFGYKTATWLDVMLRHKQRIAELRPRLSVAMMGGAAGTFATFGELGPQVQDLVAEELGLMPMAVPNRSISDHFAELITVLALLAATANQIGSEISRLMAAEFGEMTEEIPPGDVGSSTMPQKRNPKLAGGVVTNAVIVQSTVTMALDAMVQSHEVDGARSALMDHALEQAAVHGTQMLDLLAQLLEGLQVFPERMRKNLELTHGLISAEAVMMNLATGIGRQEAHDIIHHAATEAAVTGTDFLEVLRGEPRVSGALSADQLRTLLDPAKHAGLCEQLASLTAERAEQVLSGK